MYVGAKLCGEAGHGSARMWWNIDWVIGVSADEIRDKGRCSSDRYALKLRRSACCVGLSVQSFILLTTKLRYFSTNFARSTTNKRSSAPQEFFKNHL